MAKKATNPKDALLSDLIKQITKAHGDGAVLVGNAVVRNLDVISTGSLALDMATGIGGFPRGRIIEIFGPESSGKTTLALHLIANVQRAGGTVAFIDAEHALDPTYASNLGVDIGKTLISQPDHGEQALQIAEAMVSSNLVDAVVIDSVAALIPKAELDGEIGDPHMGLQARMMSQTLRKLAGVVRKSNAILVFINQVREKIGVMGYGPKETTTGGRALKFYATMRVDIRRIGSVGSGGTETGNRVKVKIVKNKVAPPFRIAEFEITFGKGINNMASILDYGIELGTIRKSGSTYYLGDNNIGNGKDATYKYLHDHIDLVNGIEKAIKADRLPRKVIIDDTNESLIEGEEDGEPEVQD